MTHRISVGITKEANECSQSSRARATSRITRPKDRGRPWSKILGPPKPYALSRMSQYSTLQVQSYRWHTVTVKGRNCHTGTTDFANRSDAMLTAAKMILHSHRVATNHSCLASTGILTLSPGSTNTVPGTVRFSLDIRAGEDDRLIRMEENLKSDFEKISQGEDVGGLNSGGTPGRGCRVEWTLDAPSTAIKFDDDCIRCVEESAEGLFGKKATALTQAMISGAGETFPPLGEREINSRINYRTR